MNTKKMSDYYPVYIDLNDRKNSNLSEQKPDDPDVKKGLSPLKQTPDSESSGAPVMLNAEELTGLALKNGFSPFQTVILLIKNAFEGHVFLTLQIRPDQLSDKGSLLFQSKPEFIIAGFYKDFEKYKPGLNQAWKVLQEKVQGLGGISFDLMIHTILINNLLRLPVSLFSLYDIRSFSDALPTNQQAMDQRFDLAISGEFALGEYEFIERVNSIYTEKYKEFLHQISIKENVFSHYQRKYALALYPNIHTEEELDDLMYKKLVEEDVHKTTTHVNSNPYYVNGINPETSINIARFINRTKGLYRSVSKNCSEVHSSTDGESIFPELNKIFQNANSLYNEPVSDIAESLLQYMRMMLLLAEVVIFRKTKVLAITDNLQLISDFNGKEVISKDDLKSLRRNMEFNLVTYRIKSLTDYKIKFVMDDDFNDIHSHFLQKQLEFLDQQIIQIQKDIKEVLKLKSEVSISKTGKKQ